MAILPRSKIVMTTLAGSLMAVTILRGIPRPEGNNFALRRHHYRFEDENSISDEALHGAFGKSLVIVDPLKYLLAKEFDDGSRLRSSGTEMIPESQIANEGVYFSSGLWDSDIPRPSCPDGDDEHIYQVRRAYPCRFNHESYR